LSETVPVSILHCHSTFSLGGKEARAVQLMNAFGERAHHTILSATREFGAREAIAKGVLVDFPDNVPSLTGKPAPARYRALARYMRGFDLVLTYNWGAMDAVGARRMFPSGCPPLIHAEDGFNSSEAWRLNWKRNAFRRLMLPTAYALVVPSRQLESIARAEWRQPRSKLYRIGNGIDVDAYAPRPKSDAIPGFKRHTGEVVIGTLAGLRAVKNIPRLVRAFAALPANARLIIVGEGPERATIEGEIARQGVADRVLLSGFLPNPHKYIGLFDIFALSSDSEQFPISVAEAMAAGLPVAATNVGDIAAMLPAANQDFVTSLGDDAAFETALSHLAADAGLRRSIGEANRAQAKAALGATDMIARYTNLYNDALKHSRAAKSLL
jgi:glycosyltransferase involved in cell wall biosynthesis